MKPVPEAGRETVAASHHHADFEERVRRYFRVVYAFAYSRLHRSDAAEDVTQEVFLRAYRIVQGGRRVTSFVPWIMGIAKNCIKEEIRRNRRAAARLPAPAEKKPSPLPESVRRAIEKLGDRPRWVLTLKYVEGKSCGEIARETGMSLSAVKVMLFRAYEFIRKKVDHEMC